jgi:AAA ATPase domain
VGNLFEIEDLGAKDLKGIAGSMRAWAALRSSSVESRFEALHTGALTELVGREEELDLLLRRWSKATTGEGQVVLLSGEPGIGKSRLTAALMERLAGEPPTRLRYFCSPQHTDRIYGLRTARGEKMLKGTWRLISPHMLEFPATLVETINSAKRDWRYLASQSGCDARGPQNYDTTLETFIVIVLGCGRRMPCFAQRLMCKIFPRRMA